MVLNVFVTCTREAEYKMLGDEEIDGRKRKGEKYKVLRQGI